MDNNTREGMRWLKQSAHTLEVTQSNLEHNFYSDACFNSQQCAEMSVKAFLYKNGLRAITGHSVTVLLYKAMDIDGEFSKFITSGGKLDRYYIQTRYPDALPELVPFEAYFLDDAKSAIYLAEEIFDFVSSKF